MIFDNCSTATKKAPEQNPKYGNCSDAFFVVLDDALSLHGIHNFFKSGNVGACHIVAF